MPARTALAPGGIPGRFARLGGFPEGEIHGVMFAVVHFDAGAGHHIPQFAARQHAVPWEFFHRVVDIALDGIGQAVVHQGLHGTDNIGNMLGHAGIDLDTAYIQLVHDFKIGFDIAAADVAPLHAFFVGRLDNLIVHVRKILNMGHLIAFLLEEAMDDVPRHERSGVADVGMVIRGDTADIDADLAFLLRDEGLLFTAHCVIDFDFFCIHAVHLAHCACAVAHRVMPALARLFATRLSTRSSPIRGIISASSGPCWLPVRATRTGR